MQEIKQNNNKLTVAIVWIMFIVVGIVLSGAIFLKIVTATATWTNNNTVITRSIPFNLVITPQETKFEYLGFFDIEPTNKLRPVIEVNQIVYGEEVVEIQPGSVEEMILERWGKDTPQAIAVFKAESGLRCDAYNVNTNGTVDVGVAQLNSIHYNDDFTIADAVDCEKNLDKAYEMWKAQGWTPWVAYLNGNYLAHLEQ